MSAACQTIDPTHFRQALGHFASGITVITARLDDLLVGFTCQSFYSVSMTPPLVSFCVSKGSSSYATIRKAGRFSVNILSAEQQGLCSQFARPGLDRFQGLAWHRSPLGNPLLPDTVQWLDCEIRQEHEAGDHLIVVGEVRALSQQPASATPLLYLNGCFARTAPPPQ